MVTNKKLLKTLRILQIIEIILFTMFFSSMPRVGSDIYMIIATVGIVMVLYFANTIALVVLGIITVSQCYKIENTSFRSFALTAAWMNSLGFIIGWLPALSQVYGIFTVIITSVAIGNFTDESPSSEDIAIS